MGNCLYRVSVGRNPQPPPLPLLPSVCPSCLYTFFLFSSPLIPSFFFLFPSYPSLLCSPLLSLFAFQSVPSRSLPGNSLQPSPALQPYSLPFPCCPMTLLFLWHQSLPVLSTIPTASNSSSPLVLQPQFSLCSSLPFSLSSWETSVEVTRCSDCPLWGCPLGGLLLRCWELE